MSYFSDSLGDLEGLNMSTLRQPNQGWWYKTPWQQYKLVTDGLGSSSVEKALRALGDCELNASQQCAVTAKTASRMQGWIKRSTDSRSRKKIIPYFTQHSQDSVVLDLPGTRKTSINWSKLGESHQHGQGWKWEYSRVPRWYWMKHTQMSTSGVLTMYSL